MEQDPRTEQDFTIAELEQYSEQYQRHLEDLQDVAGNAALMTEMTAEPLPLIDWQIPLGVHFID
jgi:hypothetical protein